MRFDIQRGLFITVLVIILYLVAPPLFYIFKSSLYVGKAFGPTSFSFQNYVDLSSTRGTSEMLFNSLWFAIGSSLIALVIGTLLAWIVERTDTPFKNLAYLSAFISFAIPGIIKVIGWILLLGPKGGVINLWLKALLGLKSPPLNIFTLTGMILIEGVLWTPMVFLFMAASFHSMDPSLEESASMSGAGIGKTFYHITFKLAMPTVLAVLLLTSIRSIESFEIPALIGIPGRVMVLTTEIYFKLKSGFTHSYGLASAYAVMLIVIVGIGLYFYTRATRQAQNYYIITGKGFRPKLINVGKWRHLTTALVFVLPIFVLLPVFVLLWASFLPYFIVPSLEAFSKLTFGTYLSIFKNTNVLVALKNSLLVSFTSATATMLLTAVTAWIVVRTDLRGKSLLDYLASFPLIFPGIVLGVALLVTYLTLPIPLYGTIWILAVAYITKFMPYGIRFCFPGIVQISKELEESAQMSGASWGMVFSKIVVPLMMPSLFAGWIYVFLISIRELSVAVILSHPGSQVISVAIFEMWENAQIAEIGAFSISLTLVLVCIGAAFFKLSKRYGVQRQYTGG
jgi:iron(III) transport system permease protein